MNKQIVFYNHPKGTNRVAFTVTSETVENLMKRGVVEPGALTVVKPFKGDKMDEDTRAKLMHIDKVRFNSYTSPTDVEFDVEMLSMYYLNMYRQYRLNALNLLDTLEIRARSMNREDILEEIYKDKQILRDMPDNVDYSQVAIWQDVAIIIPQELLINYEEKYSYRFARGN